MPTWTSIEELPSSARTNRRLLLKGVALGAAYGLLLRGTFGNSTVSRWIGSHNLAGVTAIMTLSFLLLGPFVIGFLTISRAEAHSSSSVSEWIFAPWVSVLFMMFATALLTWEGAIC